MTYFPSTIWTLIRNAGSGRAAAVADVVARYRPAVASFARRQGLDADAAEDVAQEVFLRVFDARILEQADAARGKFRNLLMTVTRHVLGHHFERRKTLKRGGGRRPLSLDATDEVSPDDASLAAPAASDPDFDREWFALLLSASLARLERENPDYHRCLRAFVLEEKSHREIARELGKTEAMVRNAISRGKAKLVGIFRDEVSAYASTRAELQEELGALSKLIAVSPSSTSRGGSSRRATPRSRP